MDGRRVSEVSETLTSTGVDGFGKGTDAKPSRTHACRCFYVPPIET
jgi:hypothetical protein